MPAGEATATRIEANGLSHNVLEQGEGPPVLLLHGWPDTAELWRQTMPVLAEAGFRAIAPDLRGRGETDRPETVDDYSLGHVMLDLVGILDALDLDRAHVVGHDWGAVTAWLFAAIQQDRTDRLVAVSVGHPSGFSRPSAEDLARSWYIWLFQFEDVAEKLLQAHDWKLFQAFFATTGEADRYIEDLSRPGALTASLNWYRANNHPRRFLDPPIELPQIKAPTLGVFGRREVAVTEKRMTESEQWVDGPWRYELFEDAGHWIPLEQPERFNALLVEFLQDGDGK
jgi:pimeloyl-ACP methyl ester carboxylesterase